MPSKEPAKKKAELTALAPEAYSPTRLRTFLNQPYIYGVAIFVAECLALFPRFFLAPFLVEASAQLPPRDIYSNVTFPSLTSRTYRQLTLSCIATCCTGAATTGARLLDLHRSFSHQASHTTQPPSFRAAATTACVAARAAMPNSEAGSVVCCVPSCPGCHVKS
jgi:hypothetical protein